MCYGRLIYMPMSYLYGKRFVGPITSLVQSLRSELYTQPYHQLHWNKARNTIYKVDYVHNSSLPVHQLYMYLCINVKIGYGGEQGDLYYPHPLVQDVVWGFLHHVVEPLIN